MTNINARKSKRLVCGLAFVLFFCLTLQAPLMSYGMGGMDCKTKITCASCGCVLNSIASPLILSPFFTELVPAPVPQVSEVLLIPEPHIHPPR